MDGQYVTYANTGSGTPYLDSPGAKAMSVWFDILSSTRHWEMEPYFDIDNGRGLALEDSDYLVYIEKPGPIELIVEHHSYDILWINPANGETVRKKWSGDHFTSEPPDRSHDWLLRVVRLSRIESMNKSYKLESREDHDGNFAPIAIQEIEANTAKVPFAIEQPSGDLPFAAPRSEQVLQAGVARRPRWEFRADRDPGDRGQHRQGALRHRAAFRRSSLRRARLLFRQDHARKPRYAVDALALDRRRGG